MPANGGNRTVGPYLAAIRSGAVANLPQPSAPRNAACFLLNDVLDMFQEAEPHWPFYRTPVPSQFHNLSLRPVLGSWNGGGPEAAIRQLQVLNLGLRSWALWKRRFWPQ